MGQPPKIHFIVDLPTWHPVYMNFLWRPLLARPSAIELASLGIQKDEMFDDIARESAFFMR